MVYTYLLDRLAGTDGMGPGGSISHEQLRAMEHENRVFGAELAREDDDLQDVCVAAGGGEACDVLAAWDGRTDIDSVGAHVFREFWRRSPASWQEAFDADRPVETPRDLDESDSEVVAAMTDALAYLADEGVPFDAPLGDLQVAGDDGAPAIPVGGGEGFTGNANVVTTGAAAANTDHLYPVSYGSSHIQAVAFTDDGVDARTILTYCCLDRPDPGRFERPDRAVQPGGLGPVPVHDGRDRGRPEPHRPGGRRAGGAGGRHPGPRRGRRRPAGDRWRAGPPRARRHGRRGGGAPSRAR